MNPNLPVNTCIGDDWGTFQILCGAALHSLEALLPPLIFCRDRYVTTLATTMNIDTLVTAAKIKLGSVETGITWKNKHPKEHGVYKPTLC